jgi:hypothetical protein
VIVGVVILLAGAGWFVLSLSKGAIADPPGGTAWVAPISNARARITKKPFGIYVTPKNSPVNPERFTGYHTGVDFETTPAEQNVDVPIYAVCAGKLFYTNWVKGYGGVAVESCTLNGQPVTVLYGHLNFASIMSSVAGTPLAAGQKLAVLGKGYSTQTDGERKHLHLAVHRGATINFLGYVQSKSALSAWVDAATLIP